MKIKSLATLAMSGLLAMAFVSVAPVFAEDSTGNVGALQGPTDDNSMQNLNPGTQNLADNSSSSDDSTMQSNNSSSDPSASGTGSSSSDSLSTTDGATPDTATGDDDY